MIDYLVRSCALADIPPRTDPARLEVLARRERERGLRIPASVREWYAIPGAVEHTTHSGEVIPALDELGLPYFDCDFTEDGLLM